MHKWKPPGSLAFFIWVQEQLIVACYSTQNQAVFKGICTLLTFIGGCGHKSGSGIENFACMPKQKPPYLNPVYAPGAIGFVCQYLSVVVTKIAISRVLRIYSCYI